MGKPISPQRRHILEQLGDDEDVLFLEPAIHDVAIVGLSAQQCNRQPCVVYDYTLLIHSFMAGPDGMDLETAEDWVSYNTLGAWVGPTTPLIIHRLPKGPRAH